VSRYGQGAFPGCPAEAEHDNAFLIADPTEAYAIEAAGTYWVYQEIREIRVMSNVRIVRQDWDRISPGLAAHAIAQGWWPEDGSKLDFSGALGETPRDHGEALRRWGNTTLLLVEQSGRIETTFLRHVLNRLPEEPRSAADSPKPTRGTLNRLAAAALRPVVCRNANFIVQMNVDGTRLAVTWWTIGSPWCNIQFPLFLDGELPHALASVNTEPDSDNIWKRLQLLGEQVCRDAELLAHARDRFSRLQARFDQEAEEFAAEGATLKRRLSISEFRRQVGFFMQHNLERLDELLTEALGSQSFAVVGS
jgi:dipeptidase